MPAEPGRPLTAAEQELLDELERRVEPTREMAVAGGWVYGSVEDLVLQLGRWYLPAAVMTPVVGFSGVATAAKERRACYVEGFALGADHQVRAAAWAARSDEVVAGQPGLAYLGVPLTEQFRKRVCKRSGAAAALHGQQLDRWRLLIGGLLPGAVPQT
jgi:hypothetical protein